MKVHLHFVLKDPKIINGKYGKWKEGVSWRVKGGPEKLLLPPGEIPLRDPASPNSGNLILT